MLLTNTQSLGLSLKWTTDSAQIWRNFPRQDRLNTAIVCSKWKTLALPFQYKHVDISEAIRLWTPSLAPATPQLIRTVREHIVDHTRIVVICFCRQSSSSLRTPPQDPEDFPTFDWKEASVLLLSCRKLEMLT